MNVLTICGKVSDMFTVDYQDGDVFAIKTDYPFGPFGSGDYVQLSINNATGQILNWKPVTLEMMKGE